MPYAKSLNISLNINDVYAEFITRYPRHKQDFLAAKKALILQTILQNLGFVEKSTYSPSELTKITGELHQSVFAVGHRLAAHIEDDDVLEAPLTSTINARNLAKHLILGTPMGKDGADIMSSPLATPKNIAALFKQHDPEFLSALRTEFKYLLTRISKPAIESKHIIDPADERQLIAFIHGLLGFYPLLEPATGERIIIPIKMGLDGWRAVEYIFERIDISPKSGLLGRLLPDERARLYAYGLTPISHKDAHSYLLFSGTTIGVGQGAQLSLLSNITPEFSVGESHEMALVEKWLSTQPKKVFTTGQSQGAVLAMLTAARYPKKIDMAFCFNPTGLSKHTLARVLPHWHTIPEEQRPFVMVFTQHKDPIFWLEKGFLPGKKTHLYKVISDAQKPSINVSLSSLMPSMTSQVLLRKITPIIALAYEAHVHLYTGHPLVAIIELNLARENGRLSRELSSNMKLFVSSMFFPFHKAKLITDWAAQKYGCSALQKNCGYTLLMLMSVAVIRESLKHPKWTTRALLCTAFYWLIAPQIGGEISYRKALSSIPEPEKLPASPSI